MMNAMDQRNIVKPGQKWAQVYYGVPVDTSHKQIATYFHHYHACLTAKPCQSMFLHGILYVLHVGNEHPDQIPCPGMPYNAALELP